MNIEQISKKLHELISEENCSNCDALVWITPDDNNMDVCPVCCAHILCCNICPAHCANPCPYEEKRDEANIKAGFSLRRINGITLLIEEGKEVPCLD